MTCAPLGMLLNQIAGIDMTAAQQHGSANNDGRDEYAYRDGEIPGRDALKLFRNRGRDSGPRRRLVLATALVIVAGTAGCRPPTAAGRAAAGRAAAERAAAERAAAERAGQTRRGRDGSESFSDGNLPSTPMLMLSPSTVAVGNTYLATASGYWPSEQVRFSWTGPSSGMITTVAAGISGQATIQVREGATPGNYMIIARGLKSGQTASTRLWVVGN